MARRPKAATPDATESSPFRVHKFKSWDDFKNGLRSKLKGADGYDLYKKVIFRGQGSADWLLKSTFDRIYSGGQAASRDVFSKALIKEFYDECERYSPWRYGKDDPRVLAMAQHYGLPTRLLDWSYSPYVAAYFAFSWFLFEQLPYSKGGNVAIWALDVAAVQQWAPEGQLEIVSIQDHENNRLGNQFGVFSYLKTNEASLEAYLASEAVSLNGALLKLEVPQSQVRNALQDLILMGIHHGTIFPGREGVAQMIRLRNLLSQSSG